METLVNMNLFKGVYKGTKVFLTGHTGFKGSWLSHWLKEMGAEVCGYSLAPNTTPSHYELIKPTIRSVYADIRERETIESVILNFQPDIVFHLAAQPLVRYSYDNPVETYETNVIGTLNVLEACRKTVSVRAIINVTSDKCYDNKEWLWGYRENDPMGGYDPYSSSKGCSEILTASYRNSYFNLSEYGNKHNTLLASCRAGNVIGGGDWAQDRLITDIMTAISRGETVKIRNPYATRPWQHVLEPLSGYLNVGQMLLEGKKEYAEGWNFGPTDEGNITVGEVVGKIKESWNKLDYEIEKNVGNHHEARFLKLDCSKAAYMLKWKNVWSSEETFAITTGWYKKFYDHQIISTDENIHKYIADAARRQINWAVK